MSIEAMKLALEALWNPWKAGANGVADAITTLHQAIAEAEQAQPVALEAVYETIIQWDEGGGKRSRRELARRINALYTTSPQRQWVGLTDEDDIDWEEGGNLKDLVKAIEAKLKEKNNA